ncbi:hypothetical protein PsYK624_055240 [Phanerochaete sordida]|uniref:Uncharacterized protein n=1 Tax=Phanerochaete sordida TaxID=48140 RepID=A0A9P3G6Y5_9APHY|nr:hypothetical protein PsYK624_055240 [Phanerochaete sordida]
MPATHTTSPAAADSSRTLKIKISKEQILSLKSPNKPTSDDRPRPRRQDTTRAATPARTPSRSGSRTSRARRRSGEHRRSEENRRAESTDSVRTVVYETPHAPPLTRTTSYHEFPPAAAATSWPGSDVEERGRASERSTPGVLFPVSREPTPAPHQEGHWLGRSLKSEIETVQRRGTIRSTTRRRTKSSTQDELLAAAQASLASMNIADGSADDGADDGGWSDTACDTDVDIQEAAATDVESEDEFVYTTPGITWIECQSTLADGRVERYLLAPLATEIAAAPFARAPNLWTFAEALRYNTHVHKWWGSGRFEVRFLDPLALVTVWDLQKGEHSIYKARLAIRDRLLTRGGWTVAMYAAPPVTDVQLEFWAARPGEHAAPSQAPQAAFHAADAHVQRAPWRIAFAGERRSKADMKAHHLGARTGIVLRDDWAWALAYRGGGADGDGVLCGQHALHVRVPVPAAELLGRETRRFRMRARVVLAVPELGLPPIEAYAPPVDVVFECLSKERHMDGTPLLHKENVPPVRVV